MDTCIKNHGCFPANNYGKVQAEIKEWLNSFGFDFNSSRKLIVGKEIDLYDEGKDLAIEYCGLHWHHEFSLEPRLMHYHYDKYIGCLSNGVQLLTIFSDEWEGREKQCKGHIKSIIGVCERKLFARKCVVKEIDSSSANSFIEENHIQGRNKLGVVFFGIFFQEELVGVMSFGRHNRQCDNLVLDRLCFKDGVQELWLSYKYLRLLRSYLPRLLQKL
jgi:hypothetical protein